MDEVNIDTDFATYNNENSKRCMLKSVNEGSTLKCWGISVRWLLEKRADDFSQIYIENRKSSEKIDYGS